jgi:hypothetical protein
MGGFEFAFSRECERIGVAFWAEPLNAATTAAIVLAGMAASRLARRVVPADAAAAWLALLAVVCGIANFLTHTVATLVADLLAFVAMAVFLMGFGAVALRRAFGLGALAAGGLAAAAGLIALVPAARFNWPSDYAGTTLVIGAATIALAIGLKVAAARAAIAVAGSVPSTEAAHAAAYAARVAAPLRFAQALSYATALLVLELALELADRPLCPHFPGGTHAYAHLVEAARLYLMLRGLVRFGVEARSATAS